MAAPGEIARRLGSNLARGTRRLLTRSALGREGSLWLSLRLAPPLEEVSVAGLSAEVPLNLLQVLETLEAAAEDPQLAGVMLHLDGAPRGWSKVLSVRRAVQRLRAQGKVVAVYAEALDAESLLLASAADRIWVPESGQVFLVGLRTEAFFFRELLGRLDVEPEVVRIGSHKTAAESLTREGMSPEEREQVEAYADDLYDALVESLAAGRRLDPGTVRDLVDRGPYHAAAARDAGLVDDCIYPDEIEERLEALTPAPGPTAGPRRIAFVDAGVYHALRAGDSGWRPLLSALPSFAYVVALGAIHRGRGHRGIASATLAQLLDELREDDAVRGVVLRIESPGGDALASDLLWRSVFRLRREKPVIASMGEVAASGGYYLAAAADAIFAEDATLTGSIGVVGGKLNLEGLYRRLGIGRDGVERGARAGLLSETRAFTAEERRVLRDEMGELYATFVDRVARGRGLEASAVERVAGGRVWSGRRAHLVGLVDVLGGPLEALRDARRRAGFRPGERFLVDQHPRMPRFPGLRTLVRWVS